MKKKKIMKLISFFIIALTIFQLIPGTINCVDGFQNHTQNSKVFLSSVSIHTDALFLGRESQKPSVHKVQLKNTSICVPQISFGGISDIHLSFQEMPFDYRKVIRQSIPHYFSGSKYKNNHFAI